MERKAVSQYSEQTVWRPTIIHPSDSDKSNAPNIFDNDIRAYIEAITDCLSGQAVAWRFG